MPKFAIPKTVTLKVSQELADMLHLLLREGVYGATDAAELMRGLLGYEVEQRAEKLGFYSGARIPAPRSKPRGKPPGGGAGKASKK